MLLISSLLLLSLCGKCIAKTDWYWPEPSRTSSSNPQSRNETWYIGEVKELKWASDLDAYDIGLTQGRQDADHGSVFIFRKGNWTSSLTQTHMFWVVQSFHFDLSLTDSFYLQINDHKVPASQRTFRGTTYFTIKPAPQNSSNTCPSNNNTTIPPLTNQPLVDRKAKLVGMWLGLGLGVPLLLALASIAFLLTLSRRAKQNHFVESKNGYDNTLKELTRDKEYHKPPGCNEVHEVADRDIVHEAPEWNAAFPR
ncbi:hypothetical protein FKW77_001127 [Venturia effusa]|uniref:Mid2 domain-containing protein n=1 Tax=Venturia effusa TaxID=50376 RepID=A0A517LQK8_9PEZI|nr:hypothetical protein FKW77_001127 [Venturia effusa]